MIRLGFICERMTSTKQASTSTKSVVKRSFLVAMRLAFETSSSSEVKSVHDNDYHSISIYYDLCGYLPDVLFPYLVIDCLNEYQTKIRDDPILLHNYAELYVDQCHNVILTLVRVLTKQDERKFLLKATIQGRKALDETTTTKCEPSPEACKWVMSTLEMSFKHSKDGGRRGIAFHRCIPCDCSKTSEKKHMQILGDFQDEMLPCKGDRMNVKRYKRLFGNERTRELMKLAKKLGNEWEQLALSLGFTKAELGGFKYGNHNMLGAIFSMLDTCCKKAGTSKSWNIQLTKALREIDRHDLADEVKNEASKELMELAKKLGSEWEQVAIFLGFAKADLDRFKQDDHGYLLGAIFSMLDAWYRKSSGTISQLIEALKQANRNDLADEVKCRL
ncbi:uncharacterized protein [Antedon mediterranea]|uniref:uncharacterized protein n=1 Tax=Antedon mediterranea TaxID=105859 RepID=UPI003AF88E4E